MIVAVGPTGADGDVGATIGVTIAPVATTSAVGNIVAGSVTCGVGVTYTAMGVGRTQADNKINNKLVWRASFGVIIRAHTITCRLNLPYIFT
jgi:hypothetical protein